MAVRVVCPSCKKPLEAEEHLLGKQARCPHCNTVVKVEKPAPAGAMPASAPVASSAVPPGAETAPAGSAAAARLELASKITVLPAAASAAATVPAHPETGPTLKRGKTGGPTPDERKPPQAIPVGRYESPLGDDPAAAPYQSAATAPSAAAPDEPVGMVLGTVGEYRRKRNRLVSFMRSFFRSGNPTDASLILTALVGGGLTWLTYHFLIHPNRHTYVGQLLAEREWVPYATVFLSFWALCILAVKMWKLAGQQASLHYDLLPIDAARIHPGNVELLQNHLRRLPLNPRKSFLLNRIMLALEHFKARQNVADVGSVLAAQGEIDAAMVDSSYIMQRVLIWAIPILGFIGTVLGIGDAVGGFSKSIQAAQELDVIKSSLGEVTTGLAVAFDTTLVALVLSMFIMFPTNSLQKMEEDLLSKMDQFCNERLLPRLQDADEAGARKPEVDAVVAAVGQALQTVVLDLRRHLDKVEAALLERNGRASDGKTAQKEPAGQSV